MRVEVGEPMEHELTEDDPTPFIRKPVFWLLLVSGCYGILQLVLSDLGRFLVWDEAIYVSEVSGFADAIFLDAHRARGITLIVAPVVQLTDSIVAMRGYLVVTSSIGLFFSFLPWCRTIGWATPIAAATFGSSWLAIFYGSEVMPNLYTAFLAVGLVGLAVAYSRVPERRFVVGVLVVLAAITVMRPLDGVAGLATVATIQILGRFRHSGPVLAGATAGVAIGMVPWLVEAWVRFGGPLARLERIRDLVGGGFTNNVTEYLRLLDGPLSGPDRNTDIAILVIAWLALLFALGLVGSVLGSTASRKLAWIALFATVWFASPYLFASEASAPRFLLPALAFMGIAASIGLQVGTASLRPVLRSLVIACTVIVVAVLNVSALATISSDQTAARDRGELLANVLDDRSVAGSCYFLSSSGYPQISVASGCRGGHFMEDAARNDERLRRAEEGGSSVFVLINSENPTASLEEGWRCEQVDGLPERHWHICSPG
jgi:hypothetical protein